MPSRILYFRSDVSSIQIKTVFVEYVGYMIQTLTLRDRIVFEIIVFLHIDFAAAGDGKILIPVYRYVVRPAVAAPFADVRQPLFRSIAVGIDRDG